MNIQQLRYVFEVARHGLNVSEAAEALFTSQPGVSKQIRLLEEELGVEIFVRHGKRLVAITEPGRQVLAIAERMLLDVDNLRQVGAEFSNEASGSLSIATTHTQARYALPGTVKAFREHYPNVRLQLKQGNPTQICDMVVAGEADFAIATEGILLYKELAALPCHSWNRSVVVPVGHPLAQLDRPISLADIGQYPIVTYDTAFTGRTRINHAFEQAGVTPNLVLTAIDTDVIKTYVSIGLGVGIIASMGFEPERDSELVALDASHLFEPSITKIGIRKDAYLRGFAYTFIELFAPYLTRHKVDEAILAGHQG